MSHGIGHRHGSDPALLWLWCRPAASATTEPLAWELPYAVGMALKKTPPKKIFFNAQGHTVGKWQHNVSYVLRVDLCVLVIETIRLTA